MATWDTSVADVRKILSDGPTDKLAYQKKIMGTQDGTNVLFKSFEARRVTDLTSAEFPCGVYIGNDLVTVSQDDLESGAFKLSSAPENGDELRATYYFQWFRDDELQEFLLDAAQWIGFTSAAEIIEALRPAAKEFAAHKAYQKLISKMAPNMAETYQLYDAPDQKRFDPVAQYMKISKDKYDMAVKLRDDVYTRKGQALAPRSASISGHVRNVAPNV